MSFPTDVAVFTSVYLALREATKKRSMPNPKLEDCFKPIYHYI